MTDEEVLKFYEELVYHYGDKLVNFDHHPKQFQYQVTCYKYYKEQDERAQSQPT
jgi:hypothetical protein